MQENQVRSLGWEDPLEKEMTTHSSILAWEIPWTEEPDRLQLVGLQRVRQHDLVAEQQVPPHCLTFQNILSILKLLFFPMNSRITSQFG